MEYRFTVEDTYPVQIKGVGVVEAVVAKWTGTARIVACTPGPWCVTAITLDGELPSTRDPVRIPLPHTAPLAARIELALLGQCRDDIDRIWAEREVLVS